MAQRAIPVALKVLRGNRGHQTKAVLEGQFKPQVREPEMPSDLDPLAKKAWKELAPKFVELGILTEVDGMAFAELCTADATCRRIRMALKKCKYSALAEKVMFLDQRAKNGDTSNEVMAVEAKANPLYAQLRLASQTLRFWCNEFGTTPSSRGRVKAPGVKESDPQEDFLNGE